VSEQETPPVEDDDELDGCDLEFDEETTEEEVRELVVPEDKEKV
jgi:hypothetical protein